MTEWIAGEWGESENKRRARFYRLTAAGRRRLERKRTSGEEFAGVVAVILNTVAEGSWSASRMLNGGAQ